jgi:hypothetical protein
VTSIDAQRGNTVSTGPISDGPLHVKWFSRQGFFLHFVVLFVCTGCSLATWWQLSRALSGNGLSWAYTFEWPCFGIYAIGLWWRLLHEKAAEAAQAIAVASGRQVITPSLDEFGELTPQGLERFQSAASEELHRAARQNDWHP